MAKLFVAPKGDLDFRWSKKNQGLSAAALPCLRRLAEEALDTDQGTPLGQRFLIWWVVWNMTFIFPHIGNSYPI